MEAATKERMERHRNRLVCVLHRQGSRRRHRWTKRRGRRLGVDAGVRWAVGG